MKTTPAGLTPEVAAWMTVQMQAVASRAVGRVELQIQMVDEFSEGILELLIEVLPGLLRANPDLAMKVMPLWLNAVHRHHVLEAGGAPIRPGDSQELLDARVMMFDKAQQLGVWQDAANAASTGQVTRAKRRA